ncbi:unnamed protein product [Lymnaea stagnalis]|uniref:Ig-like domain-containing protein n=1 Tax=Lymnaea stagnalis TaxID=6523 RepID=A0AAV2HWR0_LYMST
MKQYPIMSPLTPFKGCFLLLWLPLCVFGSTFKTTIEEGRSGIFSCAGGNLAWNVTFSDGTKMTVCKQAVCINKSLTGVAYSAVVTQGNIYYLNISSILRNMTKILCISLDPYRLRNTWLLGVVVRPSVPVCGTPALTPVSKNNYMIKTTCKTTVHPRANCSVVATGSFETWESKISYDDQKSLYTGLYTTKCTTSQYVYSESFDGFASFKATVYPDVLQGENFQVSNEWRTWFPGAPANPQVVSFMANEQTGSLEAAVGSDVTFICKGIGPPGTTLTLYNSSFYDLVMKSGDVDEDLVYVVRNVQCVATYTIKCVAGGDITTASEIKVGVLRCPSTECCDNDMILPLVITLTTATIVTLIIVLCCIRLRRRLYKQQAGTADRGGNRFDTDYPYGIAPPSYHEVFHTNAAFESRSDLTLPDYASLPPPYADVVQVTGPSAPLEPRVQAEPPHGGHAPAAYPTFML